MNLFAKPVPYSGVVGGGLALCDRETQRTHFMLAFMGFSDNGITKEETEALQKQIGDLINKQGVTLP